MLKKVVDIISVVLHPLLMVTYLVVTLYFFAPSTLLPIDGRTIKVIGLTIFAFTFGLPLVSILVSLLTKTIPSVRMEDRRSRIYPFLFCTLYYVVVSVFFMIKMNYSDALSALLVSVTITLFLITIITYFFKISVHAAGLSGALAILLALHFKYPDTMLFVPIMVVILLVGIVNASRLLLNAHSPKEVYLGSLLGFIINFTTVYCYG